MSRRYTRSLLVLAISMALSAEVLADQQSTEPEKTLDSIVVTASPMGNRIDDLAKPVSVLTGEALDLAKSNTLGETVAGETGVQSTFFGVGVGRPIIRGQEGSRVQVLANNMLTGDVSTVSTDHAVTLEPFLADQIEVLRGPAVLLYGSGAIAGAVNVVDGRIPTTPYTDAFGGKAELRYNSANNGFTGMGRLDGNFADETFSWHIDFVTRDTEDYDIPGYAFSKDLIDEELAEGESLDEFSKGKQPNSNLTADSFAAGLTWFGENSWLGASYNRFETNYGIPPGAHAHEEDHDGEEHDEEAEEEAELVRIDMSQSRFDLQGGINDVGIFKSLVMRLADTDYEHTELEGAETGTQFFSDTLEVRLEAAQKTWNGWDGAFGIQYVDNDFEAVGDEAFVPPTSTTDWGFFVLQEREFGDFKLEIGARYDDVRLKPDAVGLPDRSFNPFSYSLGGIWKINELFHLTAVFDGAQRAPRAEELYAFGPHVATGTFEIGNEDLDKEESIGGNIGLHFHNGKIDASVSFYRTEYDNFIYLEGSDLELDGLPVAYWSQTDATFTGWEAQLSWDFLENRSGLWTINALVDSVNTSTGGGDNLPRIVPSRLGADIAWELGNWTVGFGLMHVYDQDETAPGETETDGYNMVNANIAYRWTAGGTDLQVFLNGSNLADEEARVSTSYLKDFAPLPGRTLEAGIRIFF